MLLDICVLLQSQRILRKEQVMAREHKRMYVCCVKLYPKQDMSTNFSKYSKYEIS
jgi:hypothetical protein